MTDRLQSARCPCTCMMQQSERELQMTTFALDPSMHATHRKIPQKRPRQYDDTTTDVIQIVIQIVIQTREPETSKTKKNLENKQVLLGKWCPGAVGCFPLAPVTGTSSAGSSSKTRAIRGRGCSSTGTSWSTVWSTVTGVRPLCGSRGRTHIAIAVADPWSSLQP